MKQLTSRLMLVCAVALLAISIRPTVASAQSQGASKMFLSNGQDVQLFMINNQSPGNPVATINSLEAEGLALGPAGQLLVARSNYSDVMMYDIGTLKHVGRLHDPGQRPNRIAVGPDGTIYVANAFSATNGPGSVSVYEHGSRHPTKLLTCPSFYMVNGVAVNARGDVFVNQNRSASGSGEVDVFRAGSTKCHTLPISVYYAGGATIDPKTNDLLLADEGYREVFIVPPPYRSVTQRIYLPRCIGERVADLALDPTTSLLYISDPENGADVLTYPSGSRIATYSMGSAIGIAISR